MPDRPWKQEEREVARLLGGTRYPANSGGRVDVEGPTVIAQVKHVRTLSLAQLEDLALEMEALGAAKGKVGVLVVKRRAGKGKPTPRLIVLTEVSWHVLQGEGTRPSATRAGSPSPARREEYGPPAAYPATNIILIPVGGEHQHGQREKEEAE